MNEEGMHVFWWTTLFVLGATFGHIITSTKDEQRQCKDYGIMNSVETTWLESKDVCWDMTNREVVKDET